MKNNTPDGLHVRLHQLVLRLQELKKKHAADPEGANKKIALIEKSEASDFAKQLMIMNDVPEKFWCSKKTK